MQENSLTKLGTLEVFCFWFVLLGFFLQLIFFNTFFSLSLFRLIIFQKLLQQLTHFFWNIQMMKWCKEIWPTIRAYLMLRSILKTWRQSLMRYAFYSRESALLELFCYSSYWVRFQGSYLLMCSQFLILLFLSSQSSLFCLLDTFSNSHLSCTSLFHEWVTANQTVLYLKAATCRSVLELSRCGVIQIHECCSDTAGNSSDIWL